MATISRVEQPTQAPAIPRTADWLVLALLVTTLLIAWSIRHQILSATEEETFQKVRFSVPQGTLPITSDDAVAVATANELTIRVNTLPVPPLGSLEPLGLMTSRALSQGQALSLYRVLANTPTMVQTRPAGVLEYAYVQADRNRTTTTGLVVMHGYELLVGIDDQVYAIAVETPEAQWDRVQKFWPQLISSLQIG